MTLPHIHKLPAEISQHIFHCCCPGVLDTLDPQVQHNTVLLLVQVCSRWRQLLLHAPMFWDKVRTSSTRSQLSLASLWLSRAASLPRSLFITCCGLAAPIQSLIAQFPFSRIDLIICGDAEKLEFSEIPIESLLPLRIFSLNTDSDPPQLSLGNHSFPNLSTLRMGRHRFSALVTSKTIEELYMYGPVPISLYLEILHSATKLRHFNLEPVDDAETVASIQDVVAPNLTVLRIHFTHGYIAGPLVSALTAPNLKSLIMVTRLNNSIFTCDASSFLPKAGQSRMPKLEDLFIDKTTRPIDIGILLRSIPSLRALRLESETILNEDTVQGLASGELGPCLRNMNLEDQCTPHDPEKILTMIEARRGRFNSSRMGFSFVVRDDGKFKLNEYERRIRDLAQDGVSVLFEWVTIS